MFVANWRQRPHSRTVIKRHTLCPNAPHFYARPHTHTYTYSFWPVFLFTRLGHTKSCWLKCLVCSHAESICVAWPKRICFVHGERVKYTNGRTVWRAGTGFWFVLRCLHAIRVEKTLFSLISRFRSKPQRRVCVLAVDYMYNVRL